MRALIVNPVDHPLPQGSAELLGNIGWDVATAADYDEAVDAVQNGSIAAILLPQPRDSQAGGEAGGGFAGLMRIIDAQHIAAVVLADRTPANSERDKSLVDVVDRDISLAELRGRFAMIERYHAYIKRLERELRSMEEFGKRLNDHFRELDQEMQLAGRLQRDFLPRLDEPIGNLRFATVYRPAQWVCGDSFDVFRIDERYTGFYIADAVGHGMAASLLTMFIKRAVVPKRPLGDGYAVLGPSETMAALNDALADQALPNCQFVTACYALFDHQTLTLQYASGGHPYPLLLTEGGVARELKTSGGLLGISKGQEFPTGETRIAPGDKLLLYTDGVELAFPEPDGDASGTPAFRRVLDHLARLGLRDMFDRVEAELDRESASDAPRDDLTILGLEVLRP